MSRMPDDGLTRPPQPPGRLLDAQLQLMDRQVLDPDDVPVTTVDDVEISDLPDPGSTIRRGTEAPVITALVSGPVLWTRIFGGRPPSSRLTRIPWSDVDKIGIVLSIKVRAGTLDVSWFEQWVRDHVIGHIPGGRHDPR